MSRTPSAKRPAGIPSPAARSRRANAALVAILLGGCGQPPGASPPSEIDLAGATDGALRSADLGWRSDASPAADAATGEDLTAGQPDDLAPPAGDLAPSGDDLGRAPADLAAPPDDLPDFAVPPADVAVPPGDLPLAPADLGAPPSEMMIPPADLGPPPPDAAPPLLDLTAPSDASAGPDLALASTRINSLYVSGVSGMPVRVTGAAVIGVARISGISRSTSRCEYEAYVEDPAGGPTPSGVRLFATGGPCTAPDGGICQCPSPPAGGTPLDALLTLGDQFDVTGHWQVTIPAATDAGQPAATHKIVVNAVTRTGGGAVIAPVVVTDGTQFAPLAAGYALYESTLVSVHPAFPFAINVPTINGSFDGAGAHFSGVYRAAYGQGGTFPAANSTWTAIAGVARTARGGGVAPRVATDFVP